MLRTPYRLRGKTVCLIFIPSRDRLHDEGDDEFKRNVQQAEEYQACVHRGVFHEECIEQALARDEQGKEEEEDTHVHDAERNTLDDMLLLIMTNLVGKNRHQLMHSVLLNQRIEQRDSLIFPKAGEECIGFT